jgi:hypothetical protein
MKIQPRFKLERIVAKDMYRAHLCKPYCKGGFVYATNGHAMAKIVADLEDGEEGVEGHLDLGGLKFARKTGIGVAIVKDPSLSNYPDCERLLQVTGDPVLKVRLNAKLLYDLSQAMGDKSVTLTFRDKPNGVILVENEFATGAIMPMRMDDK